MNTKSSWFPEKTIRFSAKGRVYQLSCESNNGLYRTIHDGEEITASSWFDLHTTLRQRMESESIEVKDFRTYIGVISTREYPIPVDVQIYDLVGDDDHEEIVNHRHVTGINQWWWRPPSYPYGTEIVYIEYTDRKWNRLREIVYRVRVSSREVVDLCGGEIHWWLDQ